jgi:hypothetical protein
MKLQEEQEDFEGEEGRKEESVSGRIVHSFLAILISLKLGSDNLQS